MVENPLGSYLRTWIAWASSPMRVARSPVDPPPGPMVQDQEKGVLCTEVGGLVTCERTLAQDAKPDLQRHLKFAHLAVLDQPPCLSDLVPG
jgi:hypothetical protein